MKMYDSLLKIDCLMKNLTGIHGFFDLIEKTRTDLRIAGRGGRKLPPGHAIVKIIENQQSHIDVPPAGAQKVSAANSQSAVTHGNHHMQVGPRQFDAGGIGEGAAM